MPNIIAQKLLGDCRQELRKLEANSFHLCVTSPPYHGMRSYLAADDPLKPLEIGSEATAELYVQHMVEVFGEVRRVLRPDGSLWVNLGDRFTSANRGSYASGGVNGQVRSHSASFGVPRPVDPVGLKAKDLCMLPARVALALQQSGWILRAMCPWIKRNTVPESVQDRPATALEYFFLFAKSPDYYYDRYAVMMPVSGNAHPRSANGSRMLNFNPPSQTQRRRSPGVGPKAMHNPAGSKSNESLQSSLVGMVTQRNRRNTDWFMQAWEGLLTDDDGDPLAFVVNPKGTVLEHFAAYPPALVKPCILAGTSEKGCCPVCGAQLIRQVVDGEADLDHQMACGADMFGGHNGSSVKDAVRDPRVQGGSDLKRRILAGMVEKKTIGWNRSCTCDFVDPVPCSVLDPFHGIGSTALAATDLGRHYTGIELNPKSFELSDARDAQGALSII